MSHVANFLTMYFEFAKAYCQELGGGVGGGEGVGRWRRVEGEGGRANYSQMTTAEVTGNMHSRRLRPYFQTVRIRLNIEF